MTGVAVNVTASPLQIVVFEAVMLTVGVTAELPELLMAVWADAVHPRLSVMVTA